MENNNLPLDLTYEQFKSLAYLEPDPDGDWFYKLELYTITDDAQPLYPRFGVSTEPREFFFHTREDAEEYMRKIIEGEEPEESHKTDKDDIYCFYVIQQAFGKSGLMRGTEWLYDHEGKLQDSQYLPCDEDGLHYYGRPKERIRFKKDDIVEVRDWDDVHLAVVVSTEPDIDWCWHYYDRRMSGKKCPDYILDETDFTAYLLDGPHEGYHDHVCPLCMMKPRFPIPDDLREYFRKCCFEPDEYPDGPSRLCLNMGYDVIDKFYGLDLYIHHDKDTDIPHLHISAFADTFLVSLRLDRPEYYPHEDNFTDTLTSRQKELLMEKLTEEDYGKTRWWYILRKWNAWHDDEPELQLPFDMPLPDYRLLPEK